ncbi:acetate uptake transporter [Mucilaginibacter sp. 21P]|uniref:acetate uptake transporter n=1 Tax=Mucilaginibacter sp. 21P TaxID=2778902 RepID=UPI001C59D24E|nr:acetate uptake transporter [Mucilaginibacter sp. 21P]QXV64360.1 acetate uptake transporter [Mucilaginibacter sp. 21P]
MIPTTPVAVKNEIANPAPLGLCAFGLTTVLLNIHNAGFFDMNAMILAMGIFYGGLAQIIAGIVEVKKNNTFGLTAFTSYGFFWLSLVGLIVMPKLGWAPKPSETAMCAYLSIWGVFTLCLFFGTLKLSRALQFVFASLTILFFLLVWGDASGNETVKHFAGFEGIICGLSAIYTGIANVLNEVYGRTVLPIGAK